eukprot:15507393-Heterocapsa_arctica.AAC.1
MALGSPGAEMRDSWSHHAFSSLHWWIPVSEWPRGARKSASSLARLLTAGLVDRSRTMLPKCPQRPWIP